MASYLITYDLSAPGRNYDDLISYIKGLNGYSHVCESSWVVPEGIHTAASIRDGARPFLDSNDKLFVFKLSGEGAWRGASASTSDWLKKYL